MGRPGPSREASVHNGGERESDEKFKQLQLDLEAAQVELNCLRRGQMFERTVSEMV